MSIQSEVPVASEAYERAARRRFRATLDNVGTLAEPLLDLGPPNALARSLSQRFHVHPQHTDMHDLDREPLPSFCPGPWATITAFEILEHLMNPLFVLDGCREVLQPGGALILTVPRRHPWEWLFGKSTEHFHEFAADELRWLLDKAGFEIVRWREVNTSELGPGVRPLLRRLFRNLIFVACRRH
ncbi:MAG TPA: methyltransferase domain-containing protein [Candidatus Krumholzibacteria bacterium]|nr:methyltransferase domain-containing protein [Candidatus Krumholzibacteria bacterium]